MKHNKTVIAIAFYQSHDCGHVRYIGSTEAPEYYSDHQILEKIAIEIDDMTIYNKGVWIERQ
mgnify:CR=1 FL=1